MPKRSEHYLSASLAQGPQALKFSKLAQAAREEFLKNKVTNDTPPPERDVVLVISPSDYEKVLTSRLDKVYGFVFDSGVFLENFAIKPAFIPALRGLLERVQRENKNIKYYTVAVGFFIPDGSIHQLKYIYGQIKNACANAGEDAEIACEIIRGEEQLRDFFDAQLMKIAYSEIEAHFGTSPS